MTWEKSMVVQKSRLSLFCGYFTLLLGLIGVLGFVFYSLGWSKEQGVFLPMRLFTAIGFILLGSSLILTNYNSKKIVYFLNMLVIFLGLYGLVFFYFYFRFGVYSNLFQINIFSTIFQMKDVPIQVPVSLFLLGITLSILIQAKRFIIMRICIVFFTSVIMALNIYQFFDFFNAPLGWASLVQSILSLKQIEFSVLQTATGFIVFSLGLITLVLRESKLSTVQLMERETQWIHREGKAPWVESAFIYVLISLALGLSVFLMDMSVNNEMLANQRKVRLVENCNQLLMSVNKLSGLAKAYIEYQDEKALDQYWYLINKEKIREKIVQKMEKEDVTLEELELIQLVKKRSDQIVDVERRAMSLIAYTRGIKMEMTQPDLLKNPLSALDAQLTDEEKRELSRNLISGSGQYAYEKDFLLKPINSFQEKIKKRLDSEIAVSKYKTSFLIFILTVLAIFTPILLTIDIAKRRRVEEALKESMSRFEFAAKGSHDGLWDGHVSPEFPWYSPKTYIWYSSRFRELLGYSEEEFPNVLESWFSKVHPEDQKKVMNSLKSHIDQKEPYDIEYRILTKPGEYRWFQARGQAVYDKKGVFIRMAGSLRDVTQRRLSQKQLKESNEELVRNEKRLLEALSELRQAHLDLRSTQTQLIQQEKFATIGKLAGVISHEFRNELGVMRNAVFFLSMKVDKGNEKVNKHLEILDQRIQETDRIIENIMTFAKTKRPEFSETDLKEIIFSSIGKLKIPEGIKVSTQIEEPVPKVKADEIQLMRVFINIILNAIQAMDEKGEICIRLQSFKNFVHVVFEDNGPGIKGEIKERIFEPLFTTKARGAGFGLAAVKLLIEAHGGTIDIESKLGKGTEVIIELPLR